MKTPPARTTMPRWWSRFSHRGSAVLAMVFVLSLAVFGALAPLLAQDRPYCIGQGSDRVWPAFRALTRVDLVWLVALGTLTAAWITWRLARRRAWVLVVTCLALVFGGGLVAHQRPHLESRRYLREEGLRRRLVTIDEARGDRATTRQA
ncbi:MAG: hypothetical protein KDB53_12275, partial [Planctomycetes bacterium]|nr:hypothetical protein [Planctomycetota bacterium]